MILLLVPNNEFLARLYKVEHALNKQKYTLEVIIKLYASCPIPF